jgi:hypothetical protein
LPLTPGERKMAKMCVIYLATYEIFKQIKISINQSIKGLVLPYLNCILRHGNIIIFYDQRAAANRNIKIKIIVYIFKGITLLA